MYIIKIKYYNSNNIEEYPIEDRVQAGKKLNELFLEYSGRAYISIDTLPEIDKTCRENSCYGGCKKCTK